MKKVFCTIMLIITSLHQILVPVWAQLFKGEASFFEDWSVEQTYDDGYAFTVEKDPNRDFVILNLTDVQLKAWEAYEDSMGGIATKTIDKLVEQTKPDLITMTGDNAWSTDAYLKLIADLEKFNIPWAPVMGNHDGQSCINEFWCAYQFYAAKNCIFKFGPKDMGYGNYVINIKENGRIIHTLYMMDTHSGIVEDNENGTVELGGYDHLWKNQIEWYKWAVKGTEKLAGENVKSSVFFHIPVYEYHYAWDEHRNDPGAFGTCHEDVYSPLMNNGFFSVCKELGSTKDIICGHDHVNDFFVVYEGIRLTYALKTGPGCYWEEDMSGGTRITVDSSGSTNVEHVFIDPNTL